MTGTATAPQNGHRPGAEFPRPASGERPPQQGQRSKTPDQNLFTKTTRNLRNHLTHRFLRWLSHVPVAARVFVVSARKGADNR